MSYHGKGRLYNKDSIIEFLLDRGKQTEETQRRLSHIKTLKHVKELKLSANPSFRVDKNGTYHGAEFHCPISSLEMNGRHKFGFILQTGTVSIEFISFAYVYITYFLGQVLSERAIKQLTKSSSDGKIIDPTNDQPYHVDDIIYINIGFDLETEKEFDEMKIKMKQRRDAKKLAKAKKRELEGEPPITEVVFLFICIQIKPNSNRRK